jgi:ATP-dependent DNA helicase PIF1
VGFFTSTHRSVQESKYLTQARQNIVQGCFVNGSLGKVIGFMTVREAKEREIDVAEHREHTTTPSVMLVPMSEHVFTRTQRWPLVKFENGGEMLCPALSFTVTGVIGNIEARRTQVR